MEAYFVFELMDGGEWAVRAQDVPHLGTDHHFLKSSPKHDRSWLAIALASKMTATSTNPPNGFLDCRWGSRNICCLVL